MKFCFWTFQEQPVQTGHIVCLPEILESFRSTIHLLLCFVLLFLTAFVMNKSNVLIEFRETSAVRVKEFKPDQWIGDPARLACPVLTLENDS